MKRRVLLFGAAGGAALVAGAAWRWKLDSVASAPAAGDAGAALWQQRWPTPDGRELALASLRGKPLVVNFWATWCAPCLRELPALDRLHREASSGWQVLALAVDELAPVQQFLQRMPLALHVALVGSAGLDWSRRLGNTAGGLPFTVAFDAAGSVAWRHVGELSEAELRQRTVFSTTSAK